MPKKFQDNYSSTWFDRKIRQLVRLGNSQTDMDDSRQREEEEIQQLNIYSWVVTTLKHWLTPLEHTQGGNKDFFGGGGGGGGGHGWGQTQLQSKASRACVWKQMSWLCEMPRPDLASQTSPLSKRTTMSPPCFFSWHIYCVFNMLQASRLACFTISLTLVVVIQKPRGEKPYLMPWIDFTAKLEFRSRLMFWFILQKSERLSIYTMAWGHTQSNVTVNCKDSNQQGAAGHQMSGKGQVKG